MCQKDTGSSKRIFLLDESKTLYKTLCEQLEFNQEFLIEFKKLEPKEQVFWEFTEYDVILLNMDFARIDIGDLCLSIRKNPIRIPFIVFGTTDRFLFEKLISLLLNKSYWRSNFIIL